MSLRPSKRLPVASRRLLPAIAILLALAAPAYAEHPGHHSQEGRGTSDAEVEQRLADLERQVAQLTRRLGQEKRSSRPSRSVEEPLSWARAYWERQLIEGN